jgi:hypothetical protein
LWLTPTGGLPKRVIAGITDLDGLSVENKNKKRLGIADL